MVRCERGETVGEDYPPRKAKKPNVGSIARIVMKVVDIEIPIVFD
jgi:hypothetical protein